ncbi:MAG: hypothetical protein RQ885_02130 [Desulfurococcales archaeon]|nr:hypothetical protein [Desulfurococcales archaeon]
MGCFYYDDDSEYSDLIDALLENGFERISCTELCYYDEFGRELRTPYYASTTCYQKKYWWGIATLTKTDIDLVENDDDPISVYLQVYDYPPTIVRRILDGSADYKELDDAFNELIDSVLNYDKVDIYLGYDSIPVDHDIELACKRKDLIGCVENISSWIGDFIEYLKKKAEELLRKYKPDELEDYRCPRCGVLIKNYEREYHLADHEMDEAREQLREAERIVSEELRIPSSSEYPLAFKHFEREIEEMLESKILPLFRGVADEINRRIEEKGLRHLGVHKLYYLEDIVDLLKSIPREIRWMVVGKYTIMPFILSGTAYETLMEAIDNDEALKELMRRPSFSIRVKRKRGGLYIHLFNNDKQVAYLRVDERLKDKIRMKVAECLEDPEEIETTTEELYRKAIQQLF